MSENEPQPEKLAAISRPYTDKLDKDKISAKKAPRRSLRSRLPGIPHPSFRRNKTSREGHRFSKKTTLILALGALVGGTAAGDKLIWANKSVKHGGIERYRIGEDIKDSTCFRDGAYLGPGVVIQSDQGNYSSLLGPISELTGAFKGNVTQVVGKNEVVKVKQARFDIYEGRTIMSFIKKNDRFTSSRREIAEATLVVDYSQATKNGADGKPLITGYDVKSSPPGPQTIACDMHEDGRTYVGNEEAAIADTFSTEFLLRLKDFEELER